MQPVTGQNYSLQWPVRVWQQAGREECLIGSDYIVNYFSNCIREMDFVRIFPGVLHRFERPGKIKKPSRISLICSGVVYSGLYRCKISSLCPFHPRRLACRDATVGQALISSHFLCVFIYDPIPASALCLFLFVCPVKHPSISLFLLPVSGPCPARLSSSLYSAFFWGFVCFMDSCVVLKTFLSGLLSSSWAFHCTLSYPPEETQMWTSQFCWVRTSQSLPS